MPTVYLIDASPYIFRAFYSIPNRMSAPDGMPTNAVYGYTEFLIQIIKRERPTHMAVAFDGSLTTSFRNEIFPAYKAQREAPPADLQAQVAACREVTAALGIPNFIDQRYEADDLLGTMTAQLREHGAKCVIVSNDKDFAQLVDNHTTLWDFARDQRFDPDRVRQKFNVSPGQIIDLFALMGDSVDNIPGVPGVGPKTASALLNHFGSLDRLFANLAEIAEMPIRGAASVAEKLRGNQELAYLSRRLVTIALDAPVQMTPAGLRYAGANAIAARELFGRLGFENIISRIPAWNDGQL